MRGERTRTIRKEKETKFRIEPFGQGGGEKKDFWGVGAALAWVNLGRPKISLGGWRGTWYHPVRAVRAPWPAGPDSPDFGRQPHAFHVSLNVNVKAKQQAILHRDWYQGRVRVTGRLKQGMVNWGRATFVIGKIEKILLLLFAVYGKPAHLLVPSFHLGWTGTYTCIMVKTKFVRFFTWVSETRQFQFRFSSTWTGGSNIWISFKELDWELASEPDPESKQGTGLYKELELASKPASRV